MSAKIADEGSAPSEFGEPHKFDPEFRGPIHKRSCTDVLCLLIFVAFLVGWVVMAVFAGMYGDPERLLFPTDSRGQVCGRDENVKAKPFLFFFDLTRCASPKVPFTGCPTPQVCVEKCPQENWFYLQESTNKSRLICKDGTDTSKSINALINDHDCAAYYVHSRSVAHRCIPRSLYNFTDELLDSIVFQGSSLSKAEKFETITTGVKYAGRFVQFQQLAEGVFNDVRRLWPYLLLGFVVAMVVSFLWILLLRLIATVMVWLSLILFTGLCGFGSYYSLNRYIEIRNQANVTVVNDVDRDLSESLNEASNNETLWLVIFIVIISVFVICLLVFIFLRKRVTLAIALINEASKAVGSIMSTLFFPIIPYLMHIIFIIFFCLVAILLASSGIPQYRVVCEGDCSCSPLQENATCFPSNFSAPLCRNREAVCQFFNYDKHPILTNMHTLNVFALFWTTCFVSAFCEMVLAGAFASWYWTFNKSDLAPTPVLNSVGRTFRYHVGTLAFGALVIAIVRMIRLLFEYVDYKIKQYSDNAVVKAMSCLCRCCLWCLENFLRFINRNAYIYCAIYGKNFCVSARKSFSMIMRNIVRVFVLDKVTDFLLLIGKLVITIGMAFLSFCVFSNEIFDLKDHLPHINYYLTPVILITVGTFFIASAFFDVYNMAVDTLFFCFLEDCERNDGSTEKPYFMSKDLMKILDNSKQPKTD